MNAALQMQGGLVNPDDGFSPAQSGFFDALSEVEHLLRGTMKQLLGAIPHNAMWGRTLHFWRVWSRIILLLDGDALGCSTAYDPYGGW